MKQTVLISIIIPVYNAEEFIGMMLDSVQNQTYGMLDIILVNDGSTDGTKNVCMPYLEKDKRFQYYEQQNRGPSAARNFGLRKAKGDYILFVDADDLLPVKAIEQFVDCVMETEADIIVGCFGEVMGENEKVFSDVEKEEAVCAALCGNSYLRHIDNGFKAFINMGATCGKLVKRDMIIKNNLQFPGGITHREDLLFFMQAYACSSRIVVLYASVYIYRQVNANSLVRRFNVKKIQELYCIIEKVVKKKKEILRVEDHVIYEFIMHNIYAGWDSYYAHRKNRLHARELYNQLRQNLSDSRIKHYMYEKPMQLNDSFSVIQRMILHCMRKRYFYILTLLACIERRLRDVSES